VKKVQIIHNPVAGDEQHSREKIIDWIHDGGFHGIYTSTSDESRLEFKDEVDFLAIAGGDGTVRKVVMELLRQQKINRWPIGLLPMGTANNIARSMGISEQPQQVIAHWKEEVTKSFDVGFIQGTNEPNYFLESFGYGLFPYLIAEMKKLGKDNIDKTERKINEAQKLMHRIVNSYEPRYCELTIDGTDHSGDFLLAEIMNTPTLGPNLNLSPLGDPGDGEFEVILLPDQHREKFASYVENRLQGKEDTYQFHTLKGKDILISWKGTHVHVDDKVIRLEESQSIKIQVIKGLVKFYVKSQ
jgi:diacylglycerol kinase family enzyme